MWNLSFSSLSSASRHPLILFVRVSALAPAILAALSHSLSLSHLVIFSPPPPSLAPTSAALYLLLTVLLALILSSLPLLSL